MSDRDHCVFTLETPERRSWSGSIPGSFEREWGRKTRRDQGEHVIAHLQTELALARPYPLPTHTLDSPLAVVARRLAAIERQQKSFHQRQLLQSRRIQELEELARECERRCCALTSEQRQAIINASTRAVGRLKELANLTSNWDCNGAPPPSEIAITWARVVVGSLGSLGLIAISVNPMRDGGIGIEVAQAKGRMFLDIYNDGTAVIVQCDDSDIIHSAEFEASELPLQLRELVFS